MGLGRNPNPRWASDSPLGVMSHVELRSGLCQVGAACVEPNLWKTDTGTAIQRLTEADLHRKEWREQDREDQDLGL